VFNYSVNDFSDALIQGTSGEVISEGKIEPNQTVAAFSLYSMQPGSYGIIIQQGGETVARKNITFDGADTRVSITNTTWKGNRLQAVNATVTNDGDMPAKITETEVSARGTTISSSSSVWLPSNGTDTVTVSPGYDSLAISEPGDVRGTVRVNTRNGSVTDSFDKSFKPANPTIVSNATRWSGPELTRATIVVKNTGDLPTEGEFSIRSGGETYATTYTEKIPANDTERYSIAENPILEQTSGGTTQVTFLVNTTAGFTETTVSRTAEGANLTIQDIQPVWENGRLNRVIVTAENTGDIATTASVSVTAEGSELGTEQVEISGGESVEYEYGQSLGTFGDEIYTVRSGGDVELDVTVSGPSSEDTATVTETFEGVDASLSDVDVTAYEKYDSNEYEFASATFTIQNTGDIPLQYDTIEISIDGSTQSDSPYSTSVAEPGGSKYESVYFDGVLVDPGTHDLTVRFLHDGETVASTTTSVTIG
jgi:archaellum component FlaF (FlaF/FlaG flagellin family)